MRVPAPEPFSVSFIGDEGRYTMHFRPTDEWDGVFELAIAGQTLVWPVLTIDRTESGELTFAGATDGGDALWDDQFWYVVRTEPAPPTINYYGDRVLWRTDTI